MKMLDNPFERAKLARVKRDQPQNTARPKWRVPTRKKLLADLEDADAESRAARLERLEFLFKEFGPPADMLLVGGIGAMFAIEEMRSSFLNGNYMATIFCSQTFAEHSLAGCYALSGEDTLVESGFKNLIDHSCAKGTISNRVAQRLHELREMRNPYTHPRVIQKRQSLLDRVVAAGGSPHSMAERDACNAIEIVVDFLRHGCPSWLPFEARADCQSEPETKVE